jgi:hypothetical protein
MNSFDVVVYIGLAIAVVTGFNAGLQRGRSAKEGSADLTPKTLRRIAVAA